MSPNRRGDPSRISDVLGDVLESAGAREGVLRQQVLEGWPEVVGEGIARVTHPRSVDGGTLIVEVRSSPWLMELNLMKGQIMARLRRAYPEVDIQRVLFVLSENS